MTKLEELNAAYNAAYAAKTAAYDAVEYPFAEWQKALQAELKKQG